MDFAIVIHRAGGKTGKLTAEVFDDASDAMDAFKKSKSGKVGFVRLRWADMDKRVDHGVTHEGPPAEQIDTGLGSEKKASRKSHE